VLAQQIVNGMMLGASYAMVAIGYTLIFGVLRLLHFAHGEVFMLGAFIGLQIALVWQSANILVAMGGAMIATAIIGVIIAVVAVRPVSNKYPLAALISTIGVTIILQNLAINIFGGAQVAFPAKIDKMFGRLVAATFVVAPEGMTESVFDDRSPYDESCMGGRQRGDFFAVLGEVAVAEQNQTVGTVARLVFHVPVVSQLLQ